MADPEPIPLDVLERDEPAPPARPTVPRFHPGELLGAGSAAALLVIMFALGWYGVDGRPGPNAVGSGLQSAENGWHGLSVLRWPVLFTIAIAILAPVVHWGQRSHGAKTSTGRVVAALGAITTVLLAYRVLVDLPSSDRVVDQKLGALLALLCALGIALGGYEAMRFERRHGGRLAKGMRPPRSRLPSGSALR